MGLVFKIMVTILYVILIISGIIAIVFCSQWEYSLMLIGVGLMIKVIVVDDYIVKLK